MISIDFHMTLPSFEQQLVCKFVTFCHICKFVTFCSTCLKRLFLRLHSDVELSKGEKCIKGDTVGDCLFLVQKWPHLCDFVTLAQLSGKYFRAGFYLMIEPLRVN